MNILHGAGARPNSMKTAPLMAEMAKYPGQLEQVLVHTGEHYDDNTSRVFFEELGLPQPDFHLSVGSSTHAEQTARVMLAFEPVPAARFPLLVRNRWARNVTNHNPPTGNPSCLRPGRHGPRLGVFPVRICSNEFTRGRNGRIHNDRWRV